MLLFKLCKRPLKHLLLQKSFKSIPWEQRSLHLKKPHTSSFYRYRLTFFQTPVKRGGWDLSMKAEFWVLRLEFEPWSWIWGLWLGFECPGWDFSLEAGVWASRLGFEPWRWNLSLIAGVWASGLGFEPPGWGLSFEAGNWASRLGF